jgi:polynucleotide 5'-hydroxyl-kinase GRC3/NOL9
MAHPHSPWDIPSAWQPALQAARAGGTLLLIGAVDSGKSTLAAILANAAHESGRAAAVVDADVGQSSIGPPTCVGMAQLAGPIRSLEDLHADAVDFVGTSSPTGHLLQCVSSATAMVRAAREAGAESVIVDTTGLIAGPHARALKSTKIRLLDPEVVIAVQAEEEIEHLLAPYRRRERPHLLRLPPSRRVKERSREERAARRQSKLASYFAGGNSVSAEWDDLPMENTAWTSGEVAPGHVRAHAEEHVAREVLHAERRADGLFLIVSGRADPQGLRTLAAGFGGSARAIDVAALDHLLVGLLGERGETLGLGLVEEIDFRARRFSIFTSVSDIGQARGIRLGAIRVARDGTEIGWNEPGEVG